MIQPDIAVRKARPADAADIAKLGAKTFRSTYAAHNTPENIDAYVSDYFSTKTITSELAEPQSAFFLVARGNTNIGFAKTCKSRVPDCVVGLNPIELERIYVDVDQQGGGVGARLMQAVVEFAKSEGCRTVWLGVWEKNMSARGFYERQGFTEVGSKDFVVGEDRQNDAVMSLILD